MSKKKTPRVSAVTLTEGIRAPQAQDAGYVGIGDIVLRRSGGDDPPPDPVLKLLGESPAMAVAVLAQSMAASTGLAFSNAVAAQQRLTTVSNAATAQGLTLLLTEPTAANAAAVPGVTPRRT